MTDEMKDKRDTLKEISRAVQPLVKEGMYSTVNEALVDLLRQQGHTELHSFRKWIELGYHVKKGEKALLLWGEPRKANSQEQKAEGEKDEFTFYPLAYVFSNQQVEPQTKKNGKVTTAAAAQSN